jgi:hypothetical protein
VSSGLPFSLSGDAEPPTSQSIGDESCSNDYIVFPGGYSFPPTVPVKQRDRFCGSILSQAESGTLPQTICSQLFFKFITNKFEIILALKQLFFKFGAHRFSQAVPVALPDKQRRNVNSGDGS